MSTPHNITTQKIHIKYFFPANPKTTTNAHALTG